MTPSSGKKAFAHKVVESCHVSHVIRGLELARDGIDLPGGVACDECIAKAVSAAVREAYERAASLLDGLADISDGAITDKALRAGSKAIRALSKGVEHCSCDYDESNVIDGVETCDACKKPVSQEPPR